MIKALLLILTLSSAYAKDNCGINKFIESAEGQEKLGQMLERSKSLIVSKLTDFDVKESNITITSVLPKGLDEKKAGSISVTLKGQNTMKVWGEKIELIPVQKKVKDSDDTTDDICGLEITFNGGNLQNSKTGQDFGSLGKVKEFIRLN